MKYNITQTSQFLYTVTFLITLLSGIFTLVLLVPKGVSFLIFLALFAPIFILAFYLPRFTSTAEIEIIMDEKGMERKWIKQFLFQTREDDYIHWMDIESYIFQPNSQFDKFKLNLKNGSNFAFFHNNESSNTDDFNHFLRDFITKVEEINTKPGDKKQPIRIGKTFYETTLGLVIAIFFVIIIIAVPTVLIVVPGKDKASSSTILGIISSSAPIIFFIFQVYTHRRKRRQIKK
ncbi:hypothetical protein H1R16_10745 [Marnyiella aurantia]|uniref:YcxB family protein n=1 Tax=Marnyiella aurantia TaxID=2758037 RepID=A0A7D7LM69_9FLAO|nr:hypothetical protein [Marnyiella aurantia]MBA5246470.1 hypothetical protein [Marnyiella aurantia]QMS98164.1 hypothetical protein H1R16_10745 [Marnyiella aurantia]